MLKLICNDPDAASHHFGEQEARQLIEGIIADYNGRVPKAVAIILRGVAARTGIEINNAGNVSLAPNRHYGGTRRGFCEEVIMPTAIDQLGIYQDSDSQKKIRNTALALVRSVGFNFIAEEDPPSLLDVPPRRLSSL